MNLGIKRKIVGSTIIGTGMSIFFGFAVNDYKLYWAWILGFICLILLIYIGTRESIEELFYKKNLAIRDAEIEHELEKKIATSHTIKQVNSKIQEGNLTGAKEWHEFYSDLQKNEK